MFKKTIIIFKNSQNSIDWKLERQAIPSGIILGVIKAGVSPIDSKLIYFNSIKITYVNEFYTSKRGLMISIQQSLNFDFYYEKEEEA
jgi:hypothetical protein